MPEVLFNCVHLHDVLMGLSGPDPAAAWARQVMADSSQACCMQHAQLLFETARQQVM